MTTRIEGIKARVAAAPLAWREGTQEASDLAFLLTELATAKAALQLVYDGGGYLEDGPEVAKALRDALFGAATPEPIGIPGPGSHGGATP